MVSNPATNRFEIYKIGAESFKATLKIELDSINKATSADFDLDGNNDIVVSSGEGNVWLYGE